MQRKSHKSPSLSLAPADVSPRAWRSSFASDWTAQAVPRLHSAQARHAKGKQDSGMPRQWLMPGTCLHRDGLLRGAMAAQLRITALWPHCGSQLKRSLPLHTFTPSSPGRRQATVHGSVVSMPSSCGSLCNCDHWSHVWPAGWLLRTVRCCRRQLRGQLTAGWPCISSTNAKARMELPKVADGQGRSLPVSIE